MDDASNRVDCGRPWSVDIAEVGVQYSQFLIVTHNKRTMASADAIYGVTMEERGVTKLVSMKFNQERGEVIVGEKVIGNA